jgi:hypothetical protein
LLIFSANTISNESRIKDIVEFTKFTDKHDLMKILTELETEKIMLQTTLSEHGIKCQSVLDSCKNKFSQQGCDLAINIKKSEFEETIKVTQESISENKEILKDINSLLETTKKDCVDIDKYYHISKEKLNKDNKIIRTIEKQVRKKLKIIKAEEVERKKTTRSCKSSSNSSRLGSIKSSRLGSLKSSTFKLN